MLLSRLIKLLSTGLFLSFIAYSSGFAQCCSSGSPADASAFAGLSGKNNLRSTVFYRYQFSDNYYEGKVKYTGPSLLLNSTYQYTGIMAAYGLSKLITLEYEMGYFIEKSQRFNIKPDPVELSGTGLSHGMISCKYGLYLNKGSNIECTIGAGLKFPFRFNPQYVDNVMLPRDIQPSTGAFGLAPQLYLSKGLPAIGLRICSVSKFELNAVNKDQYRYGNFLMTSIFVSKKILPDLFGLLQLRCDMRGKDIEDGESVVNTGNTITYLSPQVNYIIKGNWYLALMGYVPVYRNYSGRQLSPAYSMAISLTHDINCCKKQ